MKILRDNASSEYGRKYGFDRIGSLADYRRQVPLSNYNQYYADIIRMMKGGGAVTTSYNIRYYTRSSGTTGQNKVLPITDRCGDRCRELVELLNGQGFRAEADLRNEKIGYKIREAQMQKIPYMLVIGDKEVEDGSVAVRTRTGEQLNMSYADFLKKITEERDTKAF